MEGRRPQVRTCQPLRAQKGPKQPRAPVPLRVPPAEEEDPRVKCKDCGAFGHKASNIRCPLKHWDGALAPQPLGSQKMKENRQLCNLRGPGTPGPATRPAGEKEQRSSQEDQQRQALLQRFPRRPLVRLQPPWENQTESCDYLRHPTQPKPVHVTQRRGVGGPGLNTRSPVRQPHDTTTVSPIHRADRNTFAPLVLSNRQGVAVSDIHYPTSTGFFHGPGFMPHSPGRGLNPQAQTKHPGINSPSMGQASAHSSEQDSIVTFKSHGKRAVQSPVQTCQNPPKKPRIGPFLPPQKSTQRADPGCVQPGLPPASSAAFTPTLAAQAPSKTPAQGESVDLQPPPKGPHLSTVYPCLVSQHPPGPQKTHPPLRMAFRRLKGGQWKSRLLTPSSVLPAEEPAPAAESPPSPGMSEGPCA